MSETANSQWIVREAPKPFEPLPVGMYMATFSGVDNVEINDNGTPKQKWRWSWKVGTGAHTGKNATALTDMTIHPASHPGVLIAGLLNRALVSGEDVKEAVDACR